MLIDLRNGEFSLFVTILEVSLSKMWVFIPLPFKLWHKRPDHIYRPSLWQLSKGIGGGTSRKCPD
jgi:hypothetical protein